MKIVLASGSPRRRELLKLMGFEKFDVIPAVKEENDGGETDPGKAVVRLALSKGEEVMERCGKNSVVIAADTLVFLDGKKLGKPGDTEQAYDMLRALSGRSHSVYTGLCIMADGKTVTDFVRTDVFFAELSDEEIYGYIETGEPMDKAGAYGVQGKGSVFVEKIDGDFFNVMGLPVSRLYARLKDMGIRPEQVK